MLCNYVITSLDVWSEVPLWASPVICVTRMEIVSVRKFEGAMKAKRKVLSNLNNCSPEQKSVAKKAKRILFFILN